MIHDSADAALAAADLRVRAASVPRQGPALVVVSARSFRASGVTQVVICVDSGSFRRSDAVERIHRQQEEAHDGVLTAVVEVSGGNLVLVIVVALIALGALAMAAMFRRRSWPPARAPTT